MTVEPPFSDCKEISLSDSTLDTRPDLTSYPNLAANPLVLMRNCYNKCTGKKRRITRRMKYDPYRTVRRAAFLRFCELLEKFPITAGLSDLMLSRIIRSLFSLFFF